MATPPRKYQVDQLNQQVRIVDDEGRPESQFIQQWNLLLALVQQVTLLSGVDILTTAPILGGGVLEDLTPISHAASGATPGTYGDANNVAQVTVDATGHVTAVTDVAIASGPGTSWTLVGSHDFGATPQATADFDISGYADVFCLWVSVTAAGSGFRGLRVSTDGGSTFYAASGDYINIPDTGAPANSDGFGTATIAATSARSGNLMLSGIDVSGSPKGSLGGATQQQFVASTDPITDIRFYNSAAGNMTGGVVYVLAR